jgi:hypothetical protein
VSAVRSAGRAGARRDGQAQRQAWPPVGGGAPPPEDAEPEVTGATGGTGLELPAFEPWLPPALVLVPPVEPPSEPPPPVVVTPVLPWPPLVLELPPPLAPPDPWVVVGPVGPEPLA